MFNRETRAYPKLRTQPTPEVTHESSPQAAFIWASSPLGNGDPYRHDGLTSSISPNSLRMSVPAAMRSGGHGTVHAIASLQLSLNHNRVSKQSN